MRDEQDVVVALEAHRKLREEARQRMEQTWNRHLQGRVTALDVERAQAAYETNQALVFALEWVLAGSNTKEGQQV
jgi:outer membrane protein TolC